jgi:hypothetical protein
VNLNRKYKILCFVNHFYGANPHFIGKSSTQEATKRKKIVEECISELSNLENSSVKVCGIDGFSLVNIDIDFSHIKENPTYLIYESINFMIRYINEYDYFINIEDDILFPKQTLLNVIEFDKTSLINEVLYPNRLELDESGNKFCVDLSAYGVWTLQRKLYLGKEIRVNANPHSGILIMSQAKLRYAISNIDLSFRGILIGKAMESAFAHFHSPFSLYRSFSNIDFHHIIHMDNWIDTVQNSNEIKIKNLKATKYKIHIKDFIPPIIIIGFRYLKNKGIWLILL